MSTKLCYGCMENKPADELVCSKCGFDENERVVDFALQPGFLLENRYIIGRSIGIGGFGITYIATDTRINVKVAIKEFYIKSICKRSDNKVIVEESAKNKKTFKSFKDKFIDEAKLLADYNMNDGVVTVSNYFNENETAYIVMEYLEGVTLESHLKKYGEFVTFADTIEALQPVMVALKEIHKKGVIHRDISPDNIFITLEGEVKLLDFGAARFSNIDNDKQLSVVLKHGYAPLEQYNKKGKQGPYTDIYALGATIYRMLEGKNLPESVERLNSENDVNQIFDGMSTSLSKKEKKVLSKMIAIEYKDRYKTIDDVFQACGISNKIKGQNSSRRKKQVKLPKSVRRGLSIAFYVFSIVLIGYLAFSFSFEKIPNYTSNEYEMMKSNLHRKKINTIVSYEYNDNVDKGLIISQELKDKYYHRWQDNRVTVSLGSSKKVTFKDEQLELLISKIVNKEIDNILLGDILEIKTLDLSSSKIADLAGIENLMNLESLDLSHNDIENLEPLSGLENLEILNLYDNNIRTLKGLESLNNLESLTLANNSITDIFPLESLKNVNTINLINNNISSLVDFSKLENLESLYLTNNKIKEVGQLSTLKMIKIILIPDNEIEDISELSDIETLEYLNIENNSFNMELSKQIIEQLEKKDVIVIY